MFWSAYCSHGVISYAAWFICSRKKSMVGAKTLGLSTLHTGQYGWTTSAEEVCVAALEKSSFDSQQLSIWPSASACTYKMLDGHRIGILLRTEMSWLSQFSDDVFAYTPIMLSRVCILSLFKTSFFFFLFPRKHRILWCSCKWFSLSKKEEKKTKVKIN